MTTHTAAYTVTGSALSLFLDGAKHIIANDHPNFDAIVTALKEEDYEVIPNLIDIPKAMSNFTLGRFTYLDGVLTFDGEPASNWLTAKVRQLMAIKMPIDALLGFHQHLAAHTSFRVRQQLEAWLDKANMPITADGYFIAWKYIKEDWTDQYTGTIDNSVGRVVSMRRADVDDDPTHTCSSGLHVCSFDYLGSGHISGRRVVAVKVYVGDVVSIPTDYDHTKMRVCRYEVLEEVKNPSKGFFDATPVYVEPEPTHRVVVRALDTENGNMVEGTYEVTADLYLDEDGEVTGQAWVGDFECDERDDDDVEADAKETAIQMFRGEHHDKELSEPPVVLSVERL